MVLVVCAVVQVVRVVRAMRFTHTPLHYKVTGVEKRSSSKCNGNGNSNGNDNGKGNDNCNGNGHSDKAGLKLCVSATPMPKASLQNRQNLVCLGPGQLGAVVCRLSSSLT